MARIKTLYDAIMKYQIEENICTNFLVWLLAKLPSETTLKICKISGLSIDKVETMINRVQYTFENSTPDALIELSGGKYLIIEAKRFPNRFDREQFTNHFKGGINEFGQENVWLLFLSGDEYPPYELKDLKKKHEGKIGFISWKSILQVLEEDKKLWGEKYEIIIEEFNTFAKHYKLGKLKYMNNEEIKNFIQAYPLVVKNQDAVEERFNEILKEMQKYIIAECEELAEKNDEDIWEHLPCLYKELKIKGWHTNDSAYLFLNIILNKIGVVLTGYQNKKEKSVFLEKWNEYIKNIYKDNPNLFSLTWIEKDDDEIAINNGYFKIVEGMSGKPFSLDKFEDFADCFYLGYIYDLEIEKIQKSYYEMVAKDFKKLIDTFRKNNDYKSRRKSTKGLH